MGGKKPVLFLCTGNSCRSQMAEGWLRALGGARFEALSAGMEPKHEVHPLAVRAMAEVGVDISGQRPKDVTVYLGKPIVLYLIVVCDGANRSCPRIWPGLLDANRYFWPVDDPAEAEGTEEQRMAVFRRSRDHIRGLVEAWLSEHP